jgi:plasmid stabilization system protein ParE
VVDVRFENSRRARRQIDRIHAWWSDNRPAVRWLFLEELRRAELLLRANPQLGIVYMAHKSGEIRRVLLRTEHHLYYRYLAHRNELIVLAVWGATRKRDPRF